MAGHMHRRAPGFLTFAFQRATIRYYHEVGGRFVAPMPKRLFGGTFTWGQVGVTSDFRKLLVFEKSGQGSYLGCFDLRLGNDSFKVGKGKTIRLTRPA